MLSGEARGSYLLMEYNSNMDVAILRLNVSYGHQTIYTLVFYP